ncbi:MAG: cyclopropane-fatty-acyl-phospholipid synthase family protein [Burkholderiaceae bacterium]|nr:cyclopropane-fatty-acyl-phospholipid synthase family protein [Burkholderiaceae bacterium]
MNKPLHASIELDHQIADSYARSASLPAQARIVLGMLRRLDHGVLRLTCPDGTTLVCGKAGSGPAASLVLKDWEPCIAALKSGDIGFAETYIAGHWQTDDLAALLELFIRNRTTLENAIYGGWWGGLLYRLRHLFNRNSKSGSRRNIHAHYDIGNRFYRLWLDPSMTYSSAWFSGPGQSLQDGQRAKYARILEQLQLPPDGRVLEIGCGWGGFAELAARQGAHLTGLTLSTEQLEFARQRLQAAGLSTQAELRLQDYRDVQGEFDGIASIEMFEAVGEVYWDSYFACVAQRLKAGGRACIQTITIDDALFDRYRKGTDFIQQYIFPGGMLPSPSAFRAHADRHGLDVEAELAFGLDYARTLAEWHHEFNHRLDEVRAQGFDERFVRTWQFYLAYCEAGFRAGSTDVMQFTLLKR